MNNDSKDLSLEESPFLQPGRAELRLQIDEILITDGDLDAFCIDHFFSTFRRFSRGMDRTEKVNMLLALNESKELVARLRAIKLNGNRHPARRRSMRRLQKRLYLLILGAMSCDYLKRLYYFIGHNLASHSKLATGISIVIVTTVVVFSLNTRTPSQRIQSKNVGLNRDLMPLKDTQSEADMGDFRNYEEGSVEPIVSASQNKSDIQAHEGKYKSHKSLGAAIAYPRILQRVKLDDLAELCLKKFDSIFDIDDGISLYACAQSSYSCTRRERSRLYDSRERAIILTTKAEDKRITRRLVKPKRNMLNGMVINESFSVDIEDCRLSVTLFWQHAY